MGRANEENPDRETQGIAEGDGKIEGGIVVGPLGALHPVDDRAALENGWNGVADSDAAFIPRQDGVKGGHRLHRYQITDRVKSCATPLPQSYANANKLCIGMALLSRFAIPHHSRCVILARP